MNRPHHDRASLTKLPLLFIFIFMTLGVSILLAEDTSPPTWSLIGGKTIQGTLRQIKNYDTTFRLIDGRFVKIKLKYFTPESQKAIRLWAHQQEGNLKFASWLKSPETAFSKPWPATVRGPTNPTVHDVQKETKRGHYVYESEHYRFICDEKIEVRIVKRFTTLFETTYRFNMALPLNVPGRYREKNHRFLIYLFGNYNNYLRNGGSKFAAGIYLTKQKIILVPLKSLGVQKVGSRWRYVKAGENITLAHEITHQLMEGELKAAWFIEGAAEYIANTHYTFGTYHIYGGEQHIFDSVISLKRSKENNSRQLGSHITMPPLKIFMMQTYQSFSNPRVANKNYGIALLLTYYLYHIDGSGNAYAIKNYIKAIQRGKTIFEAQNEIIKNRSYASLQSSFARWCSKHGLTITFKK